jgi:hypothetical protein
MNQWFNIQPTCPSNVENVQNGFQHSQPWGICTDKALGKCEKMNFNGTNDTWEGSKDPWAHGGGWVIDVQIL